MANSKETLVCACRFRHAREASMCIAWVANAEQALWDVRSSCLAGFPCRNLLPKEVLQPREFAEHLCETLGALDWPKLPTMATATMGVDLGAIRCKLNMIPREVRFCWVCEVAMWIVVTVARTLASHPATNKRCITLCLHINNDHLAGFASWKR